MRKKNPTTRTNPSTATTLAVDSNISSPSESDAEELQESPIVRHLEDVKSTLFDSDGERPGQLYHYTTASGVLGILRTGELWATNISYLNDFSEAQYGYGVLQEAASELKASEFKSSDSCFTDLFLDTSDDVGEPSEVYVSCFCEAPDILSQWRAYGDETGYCIGMRLDPADNVDLKAEGRYESRLGKVIYDRAVQVERAKKALRLLDHPIRSSAQDDGGNSNDGKPDWIGAIVNVLYCLFGAQLLTSLALFFKDPGFREEREWRIVTQRSMWGSILDLLKVSGRSPHKFRPSKLGIVPYISLSAPDGRLPLQSVQHGPTAHADLAKHALTLAVQANGYRDIVVSGSQIPLRR